jgi:hypothetical protein
MIFSMSVISAPVDVNFSARAQNNMEKGIGSACNSIKECVSFAGEKAALRMV